MMELYDYPQTAADFMPFHRNGLNVALHLVCSPLGLLGAFALLQRLIGRGGLGALIALYTAVFLEALPVEVLAVSVGGYLALAWLAARTRLSALAATLAIVVGYVGQDVAHWVTGEGTYGATYANATLSVYVDKFAEHALLLLPLCVDAAFLQWLPGLDRTYLPREASARLLRVAAPLLFVTLGVYCCDGFGRLLPFQYPRDRTLQGRFTSEPDLGRLARIRAWAMQQAPSTTTSSHWWFRDLTGEVRSAFEALATGPPMLSAYRRLFPEAAGFVVEPLWGMNEVYVSSPNAREERSGTSDEVFFTEHIDGPFALFPWCSCYRTIVALDGNTEFSTHFPMVPKTVTVADGTFIAFDFNREPHYITKDPTRPNQDFRVLLKCHYCIYPRGPLGLLGKLLCVANTNYNKLFRALFLATIAPTTKAQQLLADWGVILGTKSADWLEVFLGYDNLAYLATAAALAWATGAYTVFLTATSFVHYAQYIGVYYWRRGVKYGSFKRDVLLFKTVALLQLLAFYVQPVATAGFAALDPVGLLMIAAGYSISVLATARLGVDGTYFGIELGVIDQPKHFVQAFPYGAIPHPMIASQILALLGIARGPLVPAWLVAAHIALYTTHMLQEHFDLHHAALFPVSPATSTSASTSTSSPSVSAPATTPAWSPLPPSWASRSALASPSPRRRATRTTRLVKAE